MAVDPAVVKENWTFLERNRTHIVYCSKCGEFGHELPHRCNNPNDWYFGSHKDCKGTLFISTTTTHEMLDSLTYDQKLTLLREIGEKSEQIQNQSKQFDASTLNMVRNEIERRNHGERNVLFADDAVYKRSHLHDSTGVPYCPQCDSLLVQPIRVKKRLFSVGLFGMASDTVGKSMECLSCKYKW